MSIKVVLESWEIFSKKGNGKLLSLKNKLRKKNSVIFCSVARERRGPKLMLLVILLFCKESSEIFDIT
jgi:hypothetical protein